MPQPAVYIMASARNGTVYLGVTSDLIKRVYEHRTAALPGFTTRHGCKLLVYFELWQDIMALSRVRNSSIPGHGRASWLDRG